MDSRFSGIKRLYGHIQYKKIRTASICVIGIGGVGSWVVESLIRSGVMNLTMIDLDDVCETNINRQLHALQYTIGQSKVQVMKERALLISPDANINCIESFITKTNLDNFNFEKFDFIIDAIDSIDPKACLINYCINYKIKLVTIGAGAGKTDPTMIKVADLYTTENDMLLKRTKKILRKEYGHSIEKRSFGIDAVFSSQRAVFPDDKTGEVCFKATGENNKLDCDTGMGTASFITGGLGFCAVSRVLSNL